MDKEQLYQEMIKMVPVKIKETEDFRTALKRQLKSYQKKLKELDSKDRPQDWESIYTRVVQLCDGINRAVESEYRGIRHSAYSAIKNQLDGYKTQKNNIKGLSVNTVKIPIGSVAYRMRKVDLEEQHTLKRHDMFHIPLDKRGMVHTQRYSVPGYPCLYLAHTVYGCWEEMGRPDFGTVMVSKFVAQQDFNVLDLRIPSKEQWERDDDMIRCIKSFPLIIASMVQVKNSKDFYKSEYLIPQLLTEWIISHNRESGKTGAEEIIGIAYTSAHKNTDFDYPEDSVDNYAIPVLKPLGGGKYCSRLIQLFTITSPTYYDLEVHRLGNTHCWHSAGLEEEEQKTENIRISSFGIMENYLNKRELSSIGPQGEE